MATVNSDEQEGLGGRSACAERMIRVRTLLVRSNSLAFLSTCFITVYFEMPCPPDGFLTLVQVVLGTPKTRVSKSTYIFPCDNVFTTDSSIFLIGLSRDFAYLGTTKGQTTHLLSTRSNPERDTEIKKPSRVRSYPPRLPTSLPNAAQPRSLSFDGAIRSRCPTRGTCPPLRSLSNNPQ